jgi:hypothetical protein
LKATSQTLKEIEVAINSARDKHNEFLRELGLEELR